MTRINVWLVVIALLCVATASLADVYVGPNNMNGWAVAQRSGTTTYQNASSFFDNMQPAGDPALPGAFYGVTGGGATRPGEILIGTDQFKGLLLSRITELKYTVYQYAASETATNHPEYGNSWPWQLQLGIDKDGNGNWRYYVYYPWYGGSGVATQYDTWQTFDCMTQGYFYECGSGSPAYRTWAQICAVSANARIWAGTVTQTWSTSYSDVTSGTGFAFNLAAGLRRTNMPNDNYAYQKVYNHKGYVDNVKVGIDGATTTYNFIVPEPGSVIALFAGLVCLLGTGRRRK